MKGFYFPHDYDARSDIKISRLICKHGMLGYGLYWSLVEDLYRAENCMAYDLEFLSWHYRVDEQTLESVLHAFDLFDCDGKTITSKAVQERLNERYEKSEKARQSAFARHGTVAKRSQSDGSANKVKNSKVKEKHSTVKKRKVSKDPPTEQEVVDYFVEHGYTEQAAKKAYMYYAANNWTDAQGRTVQNWKQKMIGVWFKDENRKSNASDSTKTDDILQALKNQGNA